MAESSEVSRSPASAPEPRSERRALMISVLTSERVARLRAERRPPARACFFAEAVRLAMRHHQPGACNHEFSIIGPVEFELGGKRPRVHPDAYVAPTAVLVGDVEIDAGASVWFGAVLRADESEIKVGAGANVQDNVVIHCAENLPTVIETNATVGHSAQLEGCVVEAGALVGMGATMLQRSRLGAGSMLAAGAVLP